QLRQPQQREAAGHRGLPMHFSGRSTGPCGTDASIQSCATAPRPNHGGSGGTGVAHRTTASRVRVVARPRASIVRSGRGVDCIRCRRRSCRPRIGWRAGRSRRAAGLGGKGRSSMRWFMIAALVTVSFRATVPPAFGACVNTKCSDTASIEKARQMIQATCGCTRSGQVHGKYETCVKKTLKLADITAIIPQKPCRNLIKKCESASICGKPNGAVCCSLNKHNQVKASIVGSASKCKKGSPCGALLGLYST